MLEKAMKKAKKKMKKKMRKIKRKNKVRMSKSLDMSLCCKTKLVAREVHVHNLRLDT